MSTAIANGQVAGTSPQCIARMAGIFYVLNVITSLVSFTHTGGARVALVSGMLANVCYVVVIALFYVLFRPVSKSVSLTAAIFGLAGCVHGTLISFHLAGRRWSPLIFFGFYCALIGILILRSKFLPKVLGALMIFAGLGWLTFLWPPLAKALTPYVFIPGGVGEIGLTLWLVVFGVNSQRWKEQAGLVTSQP